MKKYIIAAFILILPLLLEAQVGLRRPSRSGNGNIVDLNYANPQEYEIAEITVSGTETLNTEALISLSGLRVGDRINIPGDALSTAINKLWKQGIIGDVAIYITKTEGDQVFLNIEMSERPRLSRIKISGVGKTQQSDLNDKIKLIRGRVVTDALIKNTELTVKNYYTEKGFLNAEVRIVPENDTTQTNNVILNVDIKKNKKIKIDQIHIEGNENIADTKIKSKMKSTNEKPRITIFRDIAGRMLRARPSDVAEFFSNTRDIGLQDVKSYLATHVKPNIFGSSKYIRADFEEDKQAVIDFYNAKGYRDAQIVSDTVYDAKKANMINIGLKVEEGQRYYFRNITWSGNYVHSDSLLQRVLNIEKGDVYDMELVQKRLNFNPTGTDISALYMDNGYLFFNVQPVEVAIVGDSIDVEMRISEGPQATIKRIIVNGNDRTKDHVILREIRTLPGEKFSREKLIRTQREVLALGYFDQENFGMQPIPNPADGTVDIEYTVEERPSDQIELSAGWGGRSMYGMGGFIGTLGLVFNNFSAQNIFKPRTWDPLPVGDGQTLALRAQASGRQFQTYSFSFMEPWLGGKRPNSFSVNLSHSVQRSYIPLGGGMPMMGGGGFGFGGGAGIDFSEPTSSTRVTSLSTGLGRRVRWPDDFFTMQNSLSFMHYDVYTKLSAEGQPLGWSMFSGLGFNNGRANNFTFNTTFARNSINAPMYPLRGSNISLQANFTPPYSAFSDVNYEALPTEERFRWIEYHKYMFDAEFFTQVIGKLVINTKVNMGFLGSYGAGKEIGPFERFVVGGDGLSGQAGGMFIGRDVIGLRGYENNKIGPLDSNGNPLGGIAYNKFALQLRYPLSLNPAATIYIQAFAEAGNNWASYRDYNPFDLYRSSGIGARIFMPAFGLIGIDWAYGFDQIPGLPNASGSQFHFTIGQQIR
jgi:outer membrane protein insertion porin family